MACVHWRALPGPCSWTRASAARRSALTGRSRADASHGFPPPMHSDHDETLRRLVDAGLDASRELEFVCFLFFITEAVALAAAALARDDGFEAHVEGLGWDGTEGAAAPLDRWGSIMVVSRRVEPNVAAVELAVEQCRALARRFRGEVDGWDVRVPYAGDTPEDR